MKNSIFVILTGLGLVFGQAHGETIVFLHARILTADKAGIIERGNVVVVDGKISAVEENTEIPHHAKVIDLEGKTLAPGFVLSNSLLGMVEISGGADAAETSSKMAEVSAGYDVQYAINPYTTSIPVARKGGVSRAIVIPNAGNATGTFAGRAAVLSLAATVPADIQARVGVVWDMRAKATSRGAVLVQLQQELEDVRRYAKSRSSLHKGELSARQWSAIDLEALVPVIQGKLPLAVKVDKANDILSLLQLGRQQKIRLILVGAAEGWRVAEQIAKAKVPVILDPSNNLPSNFDEIGASSDNASRLYRAGVTIALYGGSSAHDAGKIRYTAGLAVVQGLPYEAALLAVTATPARIWGLTDFGTIAPGQSADLAIWDGDPFEPETDLKALYIGGKSQSLHTRQDQLQEKYIKAVQLSSANAAQQTEYQ